MNARRTPRRHGRGGPRARSRAAEADEAEQQRERDSVDDEHGGSAKQQATGIGREEQRADHPRT
ncbi:hypothetical protein [Streptomyces sp. NPDC046385]|uniref:hypothetical protein n=1 Tax=unclassified Streptomyces TaxID=2593676 RepID=UPI0033FA9A7E